MTTILATFKITLEIMKIKTNLKYETKITLI